MTAIVRIYGMRKHVLSALIAFLLLVGLGACNPGPGSSPGAPAASGGIPGY